MEPVASVGTDSVKNTMEEYFPPKLKDASEEKMINVGKSERIASSAMGSALALYGAVRKGGMGGAALFALGAMLLNRGLSGHCQAYEAFGVDTSTH